MGVVVRTNMNHSAEQVVLKHKAHWQAEQIFCGVKSVIDNRPIFHNREWLDFCSVPALVLRKELDRRL